MNYLIPVTRMSKKEFDKNNKYNLDDILDQQIIISQLASGISFTDTDNMDSYERTYIIQKLLQMKKEENDAKRKALEQARNR